jgi:hypothetical protein
MKNKLFKVFLGINLIMLMLVGCGITMDPQPTPEQIAAGKKIVGTPIQIENLEVAQFDFPEKMSWIDANYGACKKLGDGWRIPDKDELNILFQNKDQIGGFDGDSYWSSTILLRNSVYFQNFLDGNQDHCDKSEEHTVRAVRSIK